MLKPGLVGSLPQYFLINPNIPNTIYILVVNQLSQLLLFPGYPISLRPERNKRRPDKTELRINPVQLEAAEQESGDVEHIAPYPQPSSPH